MKQLMACATAVALCALLTACTAAATSAEQDGSATSQQQEQTADAPSDATQDEDAQDGDDEGQDGVFVDYSTGTHHAVLTFEGYDDAVELEIYSNKAPASAQGFCTLVEEGYYDGMTLYLALDGLYVRFGATQQDDDTLLTGEFEESDIDNTLSLKKGVVALSRAQDGQQSDASSLIVFLSDMSYLDGTYAGFAEVTEGLDVLASIASRTTSGDADDAIATDEDGRISDEAQCPVIESIRMVD